jgi:hypothetical protein
VPGKKIVVCPSILQLRVIVLVVDQSCANVEETGASVNVVNADPSLCTTRVVRRRGQKYMPSPPGPIRKACSGRLACSSSEELDGCECIRRSFKKKP